MADGDAGETKTPEQAFREDQIRAALRDVIDPELGLNIVDLGLVYDIQLNGPDVRILMTMTTPACPLHASISEGAEDAVRYHLPDVGSVSVELVWEPPWNPMMISQAAREQLGFGD